MHHDHRLHFLGRPLPPGRLTDSDPRDSARIDSLGTPLPALEQRQQHELVKHSVDALLLVLEVTKQASSALPPLQTAVAALLVIAEKLQKYFSTMDDLNSLKEHVDKLELIVKQLSSAYGKDCPQPVKDRLESFKRNVQSVADDVHRSLSKASLSRLIGVQDIAEKVQGWVKTLSWHIQCLFVEGMLSTELAVHELAADIHDGFNDVRGDIRAIREELREERAGSIAGLRYVPEARFDYASSGRSECAPATRRKVLASIYTWLRPQDPRLEALPPPLHAIDPAKSIVWVRALPGVGKSTLAQTVAQWCADANILGGGFFCARDGGRNDVLCIIQNIASDLADRNPAFRQALLAAVAANPHIRTAAVSQQVQTLLVGPLNADNVRGSFVEDPVIVIDALDECLDNSAISVVILALAQHISRLTSLRIIITSRPEEHITRGFRTLQELRDKTHEFDLDTIPRELIDADISAFLLARFKAIRDEYMIEDSFWPSEEEIACIVRLADGLFIYAATVTSIVEDVKFANPQGQLAKLLRAYNGSSIPTSPADASISLRDLDRLYSEVLYVAFPDPDRSPRALIKRVLGTITLAEERLSPSGLASLLGEPVASINYVIGRLQSVLSIPDAGEAQRGIRIIHRSFADFLVDPSRCTSADFLIRPSIQHAFIAMRCLETMQSLQYNICKVDPEHKHLLNAEIPNLAALIAQHMPPAVQYASKYWSRHLCRAELGADLLSALEKFCKSHLLHWLEALSLMGCVDVAVDALQAAQHFLKQMQGLPVPSTDIGALLYDCERVARRFYPAISASFFQVYMSVLTFSPTDSPLRHLHIAEKLNTIQLRAGSDEIWGPTLTSLSPEAGAVAIYALDFSPDGQMLASCSSQHPLQLWDVRTGALLQDFHDPAVDTAHCVAFSPTGQEILCGSSEGTVNLWDTSTGVRLDSWMRHSVSVESVAWSRDTTLAASGASDGSVSLWAVASAPEAALPHHRSKVRKVVFAPDGALLTASEDKTCKVWDSRTASLTLTLQHAFPVTAVAVSADNSIIACGLHGGEIVLWRRADGQRLHSLVGPSEAAVVSLAFYPGARLAAAYDYFSVILWDVTSARRLKSLAFISADTAAFSPDGIHIAHAITSPIEVRQWPADTPEGADDEILTFFSPVVGLIKKRLGLHANPSQPPTSGSTPRLIEVAIISPNPGQNLILAIHETEFRFLEVSTGACSRTIQHDGRVYRFKAYSPGPRGDLFLDVADEPTIYVWDTETGKCVKTLCDHTDSILDVVPISDGKHIVSASTDGTIRRWHYDRDPSSQTTSDVLFQCSGVIRTFAVSPDGRWILVALDLPPEDDSSPNPSSAALYGSVLVKPTRQPLEIDGLCPALCLHDSASGRTVWLEHHQAWVTCVAFSGDCTRALACNAFGHVFLYDLTQLVWMDNDSPSSSIKSPSVPERPLAPAGSPSLWPREVRFSYDGRGILTDRSYIPLDAQLQLPPRRRTRSEPAAASLPSPVAHFLDDDGWLWRVVPDLHPRRLGWLPPAFRPYYFLPSRYCAANGQCIAYKSNGGLKLVILDLSLC
ncbi:hypothetical protein PYCCODRAFT_1435873 [Trametes coccinea BRFM310]|uniref:Nephrocystin 3-like N-terminal domain-containing protein n=1 Tax=Trametes coccinea (strain BRFM310) TaxID=1353009 RepID=A0A1Y2IL46_TRAC3|nr:hypothetical protein PYCCODRAFT_1435873 [Trametes coccinea BRFM310]